MANSVDTEQTAPSAGSGSTLFAKIRLLENLQLSLLTRKPVFGVFDQLRLKPACAATEAS